ncbi:MAG TPA: fluoride efflux transporter CrcB [Flavobacterium sp.]|nr:fluoride efflux transporter CrcB [Flavobacterium sp.]
MIKTLLLVGLGGGLGSILRYLSSVLVTRHFNTAFPLATFLVNITGCFLIGLLVSLIEKQTWAGDNFKYLFITGFCGGFTTFSAFAHENVGLISNQQTLIAFAYIAASVVIGLLFIWLGMAAGRLF